MRLRFQGLKSLKRIYSSHILRILYFDYSINISLENKFTGFLSFVGVFGVFIVYILCQTTYFLFLVVINICNMYYLLVLIKYVVSINQYCSSYLPVVYFTITCRFRITTLPNNATKQRYQTTVYQCLSVVNQLLMNVYR